MHCKATISILLFIVFCASPASSVLLPSGFTEYQGQVNVEEVEEMLKAALEQLREGDAAGATDRLAEAIMFIRNNAPLKIAKLFLCSEVRDYDDYDAKQGFVLKSGEPLLLYIEPEGYGVRKEGGEYLIWISQDVEIKDGKGDVIFQRNNWVEYKKAFPTPVFPFYMTNRVRDIPAGLYTYTYTLKDHLKNTFLTESFEFTVR
jgi:hypothetical protein